MPRSHASFQIVVATVAGERELKTGILFYFYFFIFLLFWLHLAACRILIPQPGIELTPPALETES